jgi:hypothetical protein
MSLEEINVVLDCPNSLRALNDVPLNGGTKTFATIRKVTEAPTGKVFAETTRANKKVLEAKPSGRKRSIGELERMVRFCPSMYASQFS